MKYGLIVHFKTRNLGDDIQCYAMEKFLPHVDYLIDREHLDSFYTPTGEKVAALLGGWYLHNPLNWPPSPFLKLLPISFHLTNKDAKGTFTLTDYGSEWLKKIAPIGCCDEGTAEFLESYGGVKAYVSGCFTLTIEPFANVVKHGKIVLVDCPKEVVDFVKKNTKKKIVTVSHRYATDKLPPEVVTFAEENDAKDIIPTSHEPEQFDEPHEKVFYKGTWSYRRALMEGLLRFYQGASLVVTSRLHAALPRLALGTPVLMINGERKLNHYRFSTYTPYINYTTPEDLLLDNSYVDNTTPNNFSLADIPDFDSTTPNDLLVKKIFFDFDNPPPNPSGHKKFVKRIKKACAEFITSCENSNEPKVDVELWRDYCKRTLRMKQIMQMIMPHAYLSNFELITPTF